MPDVVDTRGVLDMLRQFPKQARKGAVAGVRKACLIVHREAVRNAPISPTNNQYSKAVLKRKKRTSRRLHPGGLSRSIEWDARDMEGAVFVASNSEAARYAKRIHDEKGKTWHKRGPGTVAKGARADDKFIERAVRDNERLIDGIIESEMRRVVANG